MANIKRGISYNFKKHTENFGDKIIVFIPGSGCNKTLFNAYMNKFPEYDVYAIDMPGHGDSEDTGYSFENYVDAAIDFISDLKNVIVVGHSLGGTIALEVASRQLPNVIGCVMLSSGATFPSTKEEFKNVLAKMKKGKVDKLAIIKSGMPIWNLNILKALPNLEKNDVTIKDFLIDEVLDIREDVEKVKCPVELMVGSLDYLAKPEYSMEIHEKLPNSNLTVVKGYRHLMFLSEIDKVIEKIKTI